jgi:hypothetical protein
MATRASDLDFGINNEAIVLSLLEQHFKTTFNRNKRGAVFDYTSTDGSIEVELKSRRVAHNKYDTTLVGQNKVTHCDKDAGKTYYFAFLFTDGLYIIKYEPEVFVTYERDDNYRRGARSDCYNPIQHLVKIPVCSLSMIHPTPLTEVVVQ